MVRQGKEGQQPGEVGQQYLEYFGIAAKPDGLSIKQGQLLVVLPTDSHYGALTALEFVDKPHKGDDGCLGTGLEFNVHRHLRELLEYLSQSRNGFVLSGHLPPLFREVHFNLVLHQRQFVGVELAHQPIHPAGPPEVRIVVNHQYSIFGHAHVHLQHVHSLFCRFKRLY
jgi:hypothetical protein